MYKLASFTVSRYQEIGAIFFTFFRKWSDILTKPIEQVVRQFRKYVSVKLVKISEIKLSLLTNWFDSRHCKFCIISRNLRFTISFFFLIYNASYTCRCIWQCLDFVFKIKIGISRTFDDIWKIKYFMVSTPNPTQMFPYAQQTLWLYVL